MQIHEVMSRDVECTRPHATLLEAAGRMKDRNVGALPVCDDDEQLIGIITDRDIIVRSIADGADPIETRVRDVMTSELIYCFEDDDMTEAARLMRVNQVRRIIVLSRGKQMVGIVSLGDLAVKAGDADLAAKTLEVVSEPSFLLM